ncbi:response regulator [Comamonas aquatica]|nr:response regulator [Comamonas aquatica]
MESLGHLTGGVAHDFNNLLTVILGNSEILSEQFAERSQERELLDMITSAAEKGAEMTQRLLTFARKQVLSPKSINLNNLLKEITPLLTRSVGSQFEIKVVEANNICLTHVDPNQLEMVLLNLVVNARDAMPSGGHILIETANVYLDDDYAAQHIGLKPGSYVMLAVSDTGEGISQENLEHVFEPFFTTKEQGKGTGLGLPMVYGFVKQSNGHIAIYSEKNLGTAVKIYLPCADEDEHNYPVSHGCQEQLHDGQGRMILLVEDDSQVRKVSKRQLELLGYCVTEASNGQEALEFLKRFPEIDLLLTDVIMPGGMSGRELAQKSRILRPGLPIIFASGYTGNAIVNNEKTDVEELILTKPYFRSQLSDKIYQAFKNAGKNI